MYCKRCKKIFSDGYLGMCRDCMIELDDVVIKVKEYLKKETSANISEICEKTDISDRDILYLLKVGRLVLDTPSELLTCKKCGKPISTGRYCSACSSYLGNILSDTAKKMSPTDYANKNSQGVSRSGEDDADPNTLSLYWRKYGKKV